ncbi:uncharacterized protein LOC110850142 [Folsomia candida]|uniref:Uncharacterized protein n=1 Tax=Folsomia candida TaxID=158441 RepID=A0A226E764_FOLCA|nr:uncharacterized protein LOC110850142 [Folsomia candida]OXA53435.1 hypothetical protein Fcan01_10981 [Folsomia candida]
MVSVAPISILIVGMIVSSSMGIYLPTPANIAKDIKWTQAINAALCAPGAHNDAVAQQFYACYNEAIVPGATSFKACQTQVYGVQMDTQANVDTVCSGGPDKFPRYAACILARLPFQGVCATTAIHKLNECQGKVMNVPAPA